MRIVFLTLFSITSLYCWPQEKVGININTPQFNLDVRSILENDPAEIHLGNPGDTRFLSLFSGSSTSIHPAVFWKDGYDLRFGTDLVGISEKVRISSNGYIGIRNTNPQYEIDAIGQNINAAAEINVRMTDNSSYLRLNSGRVSDPSPKIMWSEGKDLSFATDDMTFGYLSRMNIKGDGRVGIGVINPSAMLDVAGKIKLSDDSESDAAGQIRWNDATKAFEGYNGDHWIELGKSQSKTIGMAEFVSSATGDQILRDYKIPAGAYIDDGGNFKFNNRIQIPLTFDKDITVDSIKVIVYDNDATRDLVVSIFFLFASGNEAVGGTSITTSGASTTHQELDYSHSVYFQDKMQTFFGAYPTASIGGISDWGPGDLRIRSVTIYYH